MFAAHKAGQDRKPAKAKSERADLALDKKPPSENNPVWQSLALNSATLQPKLAVSQPDDPFEREADSIADRVMRMATPPSSDISSSFSTHTSGRAQPKSASRDHEEEKQAQRKEQSARTDASDDAPQTEHQTRGSSGQPLDAATRAFLEPRFGYNFSHVRVHTGAAADEAAESILADAYTLGSDIYFASGKYEPSTHDGLHLLAHEATHIIQQTGEQGLAKTSARTEDGISSGATNNDLAGGSAKSHDRGRPAIVNSQPSTRGIVQRTIRVNVLTTQLSPSDAQQMTPSELDSQITLVRGHLSTLSQGSTDYAALQENLMVLEAEMRRRDAPRQTQARQRSAVAQSVSQNASVSTAQNAPVAPPIAAAGIVVPFISPGAPQLPPGEIPPSAFEWARIPGETPFNPVTATAETATVTAETAAVGETAVAGAETVALGETAVLGAETVAVGETLAVGAEATELVAAGGTVLATEASIPVIGWIALGVTIAGVGIYLGYRYLVSEERRPTRPLTPEENRRVLPLDQGGPAHLPAPEGQNITPAIDPVTGERLYTPAHQQHDPGIDPVTGERLYTPGSQSYDRVEAAERRGGRPPRGQQRRVFDEDYTDPITGEPITPTQTNNPTPHYDPATGILEDPATGTSKQTFRTAQEALEHFQSHARPEEGTIQMDIGGAQPGRPTSEWVMTVRHIPVFSATGQYIGTIFENAYQGHTFFTWARGRH